MKFKSKKPHYEHLHKKWSARHEQSKQNLFDSHLRHIALTGLGSMMLLSTPVLSLPSPYHPAAAGLTMYTQRAISQNLKLVKDLHGTVPDDVRALSPQENAKITEMINQDLHMKVSTSINDTRLNRTYGLIGAEQHLYRYPGDTIDQHSKTVQEWAMFSGAGIAPHVGAWGYFAPSKEAMTPEDEQREKYYIAVQTFLAPGFAEHVNEYRDFFKYRKMLIVNPKTGQAVVADIADAGPSEYTGKHLGGSPEVMHELGLGEGPRKGAVLYYFLDDSQSNIPLGPVHVGDES